VRIGGKVFQYIVDTAGVVGEHRIDLSSFMENPLHGVLSMRY